VRLQYGRYSRSSSLTVLFTLASASLALHDLSCGSCSGNMDRLMRWSMRALLCCIVVVELSASFRVPTWLTTPTPTLPLESESRNHHLVASLHLISLRLSISLSLSLSSALTMGTTSQVKCLIRLSVRCNIAESLDWHDSGCDTVF
jgi:hypothetical protein